MAGHAGHVAFTAAEPHGLRVRVVLPKGHAV
ncbi:hypothetical protein STAFG_0080 [Streptomyces afghaniensis 772]|uniref:Uncharacterized protein n=1 Tax=Streptomyces afghaniensis 772 TaxID=1283301 RepID=S4NW99_9ACTN|nr:hypothetical protein STAFG_0080 [Streptomyces afghaniensis 772]